MEDVARRRLLQRAAMQPIFQRA